MTHEDKDGRRPTLGELAAQSQGSDGWACPRCGCCDWRVEDSYFVSGRQERRRRRFCRNCKQVLHTREVPIEADAEKMRGNHPAYSNPPPDDLTRRGPIGIVAGDDDTRNHPRRNRANGKRAV